MKLQMKIITLLLGITTSVTTTYSMQEELKKNDEKPKTQKLSDLVGNLLSAEKNLEEIKEAMKKLGEESEGWREESSEWRSHANELLKDGGIVDRKIKKIDTTAENIDKLVTNINATVKATKSLTWNIAGAGTIVMGFATFCILACNPEKFGQLLSLFSGNKATE